MYIDRRQNTLAKYIETCLIMDLYLTAEWNPGIQLSRRWWDQSALDILGIIVGHAAAEVRENTGTEESELEG